MRWYARPDGNNHRLRVAPRLASWNKTNDPDQVRLRAFVDDTEELLDASRVDGPWALRLDIGLPTEVDLLKEKDLDNYASELAFRLQGRTPGLVSVWATKQHREQSFVGIEAAREVPPPETGVLTATPTASYDRTDGAYKKQIHTTIAGVPELPSGAIKLELAFLVGPGRNWINLWKPTIDSLEPLLGRDSTETRPWHPSDGRITELGMHLTVDPALRHDVVIGIAAALHPTTH
ncbi:hypothetical protein [Mycobacterium colombiense]